MAENPALEAGSERIRGKVVELIWRAHYGA